VLGQWPLLFENQLNRCTLIIIIIVIIIIIIIIITHKVTSKISQSWKQQQRSFWNNKLHNETKHVGLIILTGVRMVLHVRWIIYINVKTSCSNLQQPTGLRISTGTRVSPPKNCIVPLGLHRHWPELTEVNSLSFQYKFVLAFLIDANVWCNLMTDFKCWYTGCQGPCLRVGTDKFFALFNELFPNCAMNPRITAARSERNVLTKTQ
jgi:hypothetical protein